MIAVTLDSSLKWTNVPGAVSYQAQFHTAGQSPTLSVTLDPATNDPDANDIVDIPEDASGETSVSLDLWLTGRSTGSYEFEARSVDSNGQAGAWSPRVQVSYGAPPPPSDIQLA